VNRRLIRVFALTAAFGGTSAAAEDFGPPPKWYECSLVSDALSACETRGASDSGCKRGIRKYEENIPKAHVWIEDCRRRGYAIPADVYGLIRRIQGPGTPRR
jgi:hypothetical protein